MLMEDPGGGLMQPLDCDNEDALADSGGYPDEDLAFTIGTIAVEDSVGGLQPSDGGDDLAFTLDTLYEILNEEPASSQNQSQSTHDFFPQETVACDHVDSHNGAQFQWSAQQHASFTYDVGEQQPASYAEDLSELVSSPWESSNHMAEPHYEVESGNGSFSNLPGSSSNMSVIYDPSSPLNGSYPSIEHDDMKSFNFYPCNYMSDWSSSGGANTISVDSVGGSFDAFSKNGSNQDQFQNNISICSDHAGAAGMRVLSSHNCGFVDNSQFNSEGEMDFEQINGESWSLMGAKDFSLESLDTHDMPKIHVFQQLSEAFSQNLPNKRVTALKSMVEDRSRPFQEAYRSQAVKLERQRHFGTLLDISKIDRKASIAAMPSTKLKFHHDLNARSDSSSDSSPLSGRTSISDNIYSSSNITSSKEMKIVPRYDISEHSDNAVKKENSKSTLLAEDDDDDICILDEISHRALQSSLSVHAKPHPLPLPIRPGFPNKYVSGSAGISYNRSDDERLTFHIALQGLSQPTSEASPPEGVLAVTLLRHQRIALAWMVQKETNSPNCSGGILADDQGLGKTVSTIALILTERAPVGRSCPSGEKYEALDLDDDDDNEDDIACYEPKFIKQPRIACPIWNGVFDKQENPVLVTKGRPAAGTLVVCPTSVLRQWAGELKNKVTKQANLSFLVYHGSNRTKDADELTKYDVVLTTYAIVSMEVPKQPLVDKDDEYASKPCSSGLETDQLVSKKRKSNKNSKAEDDTLLESAARPLAKVGWFRVILDEAQSIKNYRTQVARACWGLRAKRRWCLSGTPIQNAVDDLYSYFRFLRYEPYAVYKSFCSTIKIPINRNPSTGYKKLQAVLKTFMLRRTKDTSIDGKPIISLPPKNVNLKKVDFSLEERAFYSTLETESREQFKEYAAMGTVKQNYVNILLMLLRLRQACDHPRLVKGYDSSSIQRSSMEMAKKLPRDKQIYLLNHLEAGLEICSICNDPPEDAVVTICGHVFCNQCICEHLTGDDNICPSVNCKVQVNASSVFSRGTLRSLLAGLPSLDSYNGDCKPEIFINPRSEQEGDCSLYDSSKIKSAIDILKSLPRCQGSTENASEESSVGPTECMGRGGKDSQLANCSYITEKAIVFSQWTRMLDLLEVPLKGSSIQYRRLDGTMSVAAREKAVQDFNTIPEVTVMIMSLKAACLGLNMVAACHVLLLDLWWNPTTEDQAIDRAHRIGQTRPVTVFRLTVRNTVEDRILALQEKKRQLVASAFGEDGSGSRQTRLTEEDLKYLFMV